MNQDELKEKVEAMFGSISLFSRALNASQPMGYQIIKGKGSRSGRVFLARKLGMLPSQIWVSNSRMVKYLDDEEYKEAAPCAVVRN